MLRATPPAQVIRYGHVRRDPNATYRPFVERFDLAPFDFAPHVREDHNVIGKPFEREDLWREYFSADELRLIEDLFAFLGDDLAA
jgi:hypothetical protein